MYQESIHRSELCGREKEVEKFWEDNHIFEKSMEEREGNARYTCSMTDRRLQMESLISVTY